MRKKKKNTQKPRDLKEQPPVYVTVLWVGNLGWDPFSGSATLSQVWLMLEKLVHASMINCQASILVCLKLLRLGALNKRNIFPHNFGGLQSNIKMSARLLFFFFFFLMSLSLACRRPSSPCAFTWFSFCAHTSMSQFPLPIRMLAVLDSGPI